MKHVAFCILPNHPHVGPTLPVVSVMVRRGYRVSYATTDRFSSRVRSAGADVTAYGFDGFEVHRPDWLTQWISSQLDLISHLYERDRPDLIIYDEWGFAAYIIARHYGIPAVYTGPSYALDRRCLADQVPHETFRRGVLEFSATIDGVLANFGVFDADWLFHRASLNLYLCPRLFQPVPDSLDDSCFFAGRCAGEQPWYGNWKRATAGARPLVMVATSTNIVQGPQYFQTWVRALKDIECEVILSIGDRANPLDFQELPGNIELVQNVSHVSILPRVSLYVGCGGIISSAEAAYHGVPMVITSVGNAEIEWEAANLERVGLAVHVSDQEMRGAGLSQIVVSTLENTSMLRNVREIRRAIRKEPGAEEAVNRVETLLGW